MKRFLLAILLIAATVRFVGVYPGYNQFHPDEQMSYFTAEGMLKENSLNPSMGFRDKLVYPYLVPLINLVLFKHIFVPLAWVNYVFSNLGKIVDGILLFPLPPPEAKRVLELEILGTDSINAMFWARTITAFFGVGNVFLVYLIASKVVNKNAGLIAAFILAFDFRQVTNSHIALPDIYNSFFLLLSVLTSLNLYNHPSRKAYIFAGIAAGLSFSTKFQFFSLAPLVLVHLFLAFEHKKDRLKRLLDARFFLSVLIVILILVLINPYHFIYFEQALVLITYAALRYGMGIRKLNLFPVWYIYTVDLGPPLTIVSILGVLFSFWKRFKYSLILFSVVGLQAYLYFYFSVAGFHVRNMIPMTPFLIIFAAVLLEKVRTKLPLFLFVPLLAFTIYVPARNSIISDYYYTKPWNFNLLTEWLYKNPLDGAVASNPTDPPTGTPPIERTEFIHNRSFSMAEHIENGAKYALMNTDWVGNVFYYWMAGSSGNFSQKWNKPLRQMRNSYCGLAIEEMLNYQIFAAIKPWQSPEANLMLVEFPDWNDLEFIKIYEKKGVVSTQDGPGSVSLIKLPAKEKYVYKVTANLESLEPLTSSTRDGFLRVKIGQSNCVSARVYDEGPKMKQVYCLATAGSTDLEVSLQVGNVNDQISVSDIKIEESSESVKSIPSKYPYIENKVQLELIYPNSHANL